MRVPERMVSMIRDYIMENATKNPGDIINAAIAEFEITRPTAKKYVMQLVDEGHLEVSGTGRKLSYRPVSTCLLMKKWVVNEALEEDAVYREAVLPLIRSLTDNVRTIIQYGVTEMVNNVRDHSNSKEMTLTVYESYSDIEIFVEDYGIGIFHRIQEELGLSAPSHAILELSKGKYTSDPSKHSGEGIFFTSRMFDEFIIRSQNLFFSGHEGRDFLSEDRVGDKDMQGTLVGMKISKKSDTTAVKVFNAFSDPDSNPSFHRTALDVCLLQFEGEALLSRSQAKRLMTRIDRFTEVMLNFTGVVMIGQAFADEIFRVFQNEHPNIKLIPTNTTPEVDRMIRHVLGAGL